MNERLAQRYSRHMRLAEIGEAGQKRLNAARVLVVGLGGLGSPAAMYLAASGVGHIVLSDYDVVELSNLQRQIVHRSADVGRAKVESARDTLLALNPEIEVTPCTGRSTTTSTSRSRPRPWWSTPPTTSRAGSC